MGSNRTSQFPSASEATVFLCPAKVTVTSAPGLARPQTGAARPRWSTIWWPKAVDTSTGASAAGAFTAASAGEITVKASHVATSR